MGCHGCLCGSALEDLPIVRGTCVNHCPFTNVVMPRCFMAIGQHPARLRHYITVIHAKNAGTGRGSRFPRLIYAPALVVRQSMSRRPGICVAPAIPTAGVVLRSSLYLEHLKTHAIRKTVLVARQRHVLFSLVVVSHTVLRSLIRQSISQIRMGM